MNNTEALLLFLIELTNAIDVVATKGLSFDDIKPMFEAFKDAGPAFSSLPAVEAEVAAIDDAKAAELATFVASHLQLEQTKAEAITKAALSVGVELVRIYHIIKAAQTA